MILDLECATVGDYQQKLQPLVDFLDDKPIEEVTTSDLRSYAAHLNTPSTRYDSHPNRNKLEDELAQASVAGYLRLLRRLFRFAEGEGWIKENPAKAIRIPKPKRGEPKAISTQDFSSLLQAVQGDTVNEQRNRAMLRAPSPPHSFRHGFAREFPRNGGNLASLADIMGHSDISVTWQAYAVFTVQPKHPIATS